MISFVNAKINIGLYVTRKRADGYHDLQTCFYPIGKYAGTPENDVPFCDILEITELPEDNTSEFRFRFTGRQVDCPEDKNLVVKGAKAFIEAWRKKNPKAVCHKEIILEKHLPDGAGLGGGSADCSFTIKMLNEMSGKPLTSREMKRVALSLGADCPIFIDNVPAYAEGVGEILTPIEEILKGWWLTIIKPDIYVSTKEAFAGLTPVDPKINLQEAIKGPISTWKDTISNDFEITLFARHPVLARIKDGLYERGAEYASMSGSGSSIYGIYKEKGMAERAMEAIKREYGENLIQFSSVVLL